MNADLKNARILVVDDQEANVDVLLHLLEIQGYTQVKSTTDPLQALPLIRGFKPELLLLDLMMPNITGYEIMEQLRGSDDQPGMMPILVLTADATHEAKKRSLSGGASDFVTKPFDLAEVGLRIRNLLTNVYLMGQLKNQNSMLEERVRERTAALRLTIEALTEAKSKVEDGVRTLEKQNQVLRDIAWTQSHVVRAPLARLMGIIDLLYEDCPPEMPQHVTVNLMLESAQELDLIVRDIVQKAYHANLFEPKLPTSANPNDDD